YLGSDHAPNKYAKGFPGIAFTMNATSACNLAAQAWGDKNIKAGDTIVAWVSEHHSNLLPWQKLAKRNDAQLRLLPLLPSGRIDMDAYRQALADRPALVCCAHVGNTLGIEYPIADMADMSLQVGAVFFLDATQSAAHGKIDVKQLGVDFLALSAHKMYGPTGIGALWMTPAMFDQMDPAFVGGGTVLSATPYDYEPAFATARFEPGTQPVSLAIGWGAALEYLRAAPARPGPYAPPAARPARGAQAHRVRGSYARRRRERPGELRPAPDTSHAPGALLGPGGRRGARRKPLRPAPVLGHGSFGNHPRQLGR
ncbi:MAG: aminotransferase class V-fold PLP-dependent enzyme, partial [Coriobacteriia bacterium]|nr:aminotransferase class V-fold PLP-dependent enzyme [Coriobacteriia bacterium]